MKVIEPLFLNELYEELEKAKGSAKKLRRLITRISKLKIFDPACGSGNFLIIAYKELRKLEIDIWQEILEAEPQQSFIYSEIKLTQFYGIEIDDFAQEIAMLSLWLAEHQMNKYFEQELEMGKALPILPLKASGHISRGNSTRLNWEEVCPKEEGDEIYLLGNPPYLGSRNQDKAQKEDLRLLFKKDYKSLDYVVAWFYKGANYIHGFKAKLAFVSTNSICQGDLVAKTWPRILTEGVEIDFAYHSFKWLNNAKSNAVVTVIIVGLRNFSKNQKYLYIDNIKKRVTNLNAYLLDNKSLYIRPVGKSLSGLPTINFGNMPADGGKLIFTEAEKNKFIKKEPSSEKWFKELISSKEYLNGIRRYCLWLEEANEEEISEMPLVTEVIEKVRKIRLNSSRPQLAQTPHIFAQITQPSVGDCIIIPRISSEKRQYLPIGFIESNKSKVTDSLYTIATNEPYIFGIVSSRFHTIWLKATGGKMEERYRYAKNLCYNTFPFPEISKIQEELINLHVFSVLEEREKHPEKTMAQLYDPDKMPKALRHAHKELDEAIERCYRLKPFKNDTERLEYLFKEYEKMINKNALLEKGKKRTAN